MTTISVIVPTLPERRELLLGRCLPSIKRQTVDVPIEILVIAEDQTDLPANLGTDVCLLRLPVDWKITHASWLRSPGVYPYRFGANQANGDYLAYLADDDEYLPQHLKKCLDSISGYDFVLTQVEFRLHGQHRFVIGDGSGNHARFDTDAIFHRRDCFERGGFWEPAPHGPRQDAADWWLVARWKAAGLQWSSIPTVTAIHHDGWLAR